MNGLRLPGALVGLLLALGCSGASDTRDIDDPDPETAKTTLRIEAQDNIASEEGVLSLRAGTLEVESLELLGPDGQQEWIGSTTIDLANPEQVIELKDVADGTYDRLVVNLGAEEYGDALDTSLDHPELGCVRVVCSGVQNGELWLTEPLVFSPENRPSPSLTLSLAGLTFYIAPFRDSEGGVFRAPAYSPNDQMRLNLQGLWRVETR